MPYKSTKKKTKKDKIGAWLLKIIFFTGLNLEAKEPSHQIDGMYSYILALLKNLQ